jgi:hypothetical protein
VRKRPSTARRTPMEPQEYQHRVEVSMHAFAAAVAGTQNLVTFMVEQQGAQWKRLDCHLCLAKKNLRNALRWLFRERQWAVLILGKGKEE